MPKKREKQNVVQRLDQGDRPLPSPPKPGQSLEGSTVEAAVRPTAEPPPSPAEPPSSPSLAPTPEAPETPTAEPSQFEVLDLSLPRETHQQGELFGPSFEPQAATVPKLEETINTPTEAEVEPSGDEPPAEAEPLTLEARKDLLIATDAGLDSDVALRLVDRFRDDQEARQRALGIAVRAERLGVEEADLPEILELEEEAREDLDTAIEGGLDARLATNIVLGTEEQDEDIRQARLQDAFTAVQAGLGEGITGDVLEMTAGEGEDLRRDLLEDAFIAQQAGIDQTTIRRALALSGGEQGQFRSLLEAVAPDAEPQRRFRTLAHLDDQPGLDQAQPAGSRSSAPIERLIERIKREVLRYVIEHLRIS